MTDCVKGCGRRATRRGMCSSHYEQRRTRDIAYGRWSVSYTDAEPVRLHIKELKAAGLGLRRIAELSGVNRKTLQWITTGRSERNQGPSAKVSIRNAEKILAVEIPVTSYESAAAHQPVAAVGTVRRLQSLVAFGYPRSYLAGRLGIEPGNATRLFRDECTDVLVETARRVRVLFSELETSPGWSSRARNEGRKRGWSVPLAWDEDVIDEPDAVPDSGVAVRESFPERYRELREIGLHDEAIAARLGISPRSLERQLYRYGLRAAS